MTNIGIVGGGAAGFFAAIRTAEHLRKLKKKANIFIFEQGSQLLKKVKISGGGRCNVTHHIFEINKFCLNYPRGEKELLSPMRQFHAQETVEWFKKHGVCLVAESDGRMFPSTNTSETIIDCFLNLTKKYKINILTQHKVEEISRNNGLYNIKFKNQEPVDCHQLLICTGSSINGYQLGANLGHSITERAPSLFSFKVKHPLFKDLSGTSFKNTNVKLTIEGKKGFKQGGPLLITHWGLSGPAILKLSAWAAREMKSCDYKAKLMVDWLGTDAKLIITQLKLDHAKSKVFNVYPESLSKRFWHNLLGVCKVNSETKWAEINKRQLNLIFENLNYFQCNINGQNRFKDEFVECGGISLKEINFKTMESKINSGLYFAGELLDVDGVTGGFNFQNAWTTGWIAGTSMAESL